MKILVTGAAGFIGFHLVKKLLERGDEVTGIDNINNYYDIRLKYARLKETGIPEPEYNIIYKNKNYQFIKLDLEDKKNITSLGKFDKICHLAAQAGVRHSITHPDDYINSNLVGFMNILDLSKETEHFVYASSSSVYGKNNIPFSVKDRVDHPVSLYAATKKANELMAHVFYHIYNLPTTGMRFFTVYGPWGRPDMALFIFTKAIFENKSINVYNYGNMERDFTYIDDIIEGIIRIIDNPQGYKIYNIGNNKPVKLMDFIKIIENILGKKAKINFMPMQMGDVSKTWADISELKKDFKYKPNTSIIEGIDKFIQWYKYYDKNIMCNK